MRPDPSEPGDLDASHEEHRNVTRLIRVLAGFVAFPSLTIALAFVVFEGPSEHWMHITGLSAAFVLAMVALVMAPTWAARFA